MNLKFYYDACKPRDIQGKQTSDKSFNREERGQIGVFVREALQNAMDIAVEHLPKEPVVVKFSLLKPDQYDVDYLATILDDEFFGRLEAARKSANLPTQLPTPNTASVLLVEDFRTQGLIGDTDDPNKEGAGQNWNGFWFREGQGEGAKQRGSNGGAGQGKLTYYKQSHIRTVLALTKRATDSRTLVMGKTQFIRDYPFRSIGKFKKDTFWALSDSDDEKALPESDPGEVEKFRTAFSLQRGRDDTGLSLVIPYVKDFSEDACLIAVLTDFYIPILRNRLEVYVNDVHVSKSSIDALADRLVKDATLKHSPFTHEYRQFCKAAFYDSSLFSCAMNKSWSAGESIGAEAFPNADLDRVRAELSDGKIVKFILPVEIDSASEGVLGSFFTVFLMDVPAVDKNKEAFLRGDLIIGGEKSKSTQLTPKNSFALVWIEDDVLSEYLLNAEEPTHLTWNESNLRDSQLYKTYREPLSSIRHAVPRLLTALFGFDKTKNFTALSKYFAKPGASVPSGLGSSARRRGAPNPPPPPPTPPPPTPPREPVYFELLPDANGFRLERDATVTIPKEAYPVKVSLHFAYEDTEKDPFKEYDPFDFDLADESVFRVKAINADVISREKNEISVKLLNDNFKFSVFGFDPLLKVCSKMNYVLGGRRQARGSASR